MNEPLPKEITEPQVVAVRRAKQAALTWIGAGLVLLLVDVFLVASGRVPIIMIFLTVFCMGYGLKMLFGLRKQL